MTLFNYLMENTGKYIPKLRVLSAKGILGTVKQVTWNKFSLFSIYQDEIDEESSWASIQWDNGNYSDQTIDQLASIKVISCSRINSEHA
jgi:hypothetical protein